MSVSWTCDNIIKLGHMTVIDEISPGSRGPTKCTTCGSLPGWVNTLQGVFGNVRGVSSCQNGWGATGAQWGRGQGC